MSPDFSLSTFDLPTRTGKSTGPVLLSLAVSRIARATSDLSGGGSSSN